MFKWIEKIINKVVGTYDEPVKYLKGVDTKNLEKKTKKELETLGRKIGIEVDRRLTKAKIIKQIKKHK